MILEWMASGASRDQIVKKHPQVTEVDVEQAIHYAANATKNEVLLTTQVAE